ncbi:energy transducer TonB [Janthinobacterium fluminis]|uniref:Energy transducer TonB n=1 Tax=Janthinobacterium fluminis TaxID=2987524 RepID=A0ABT5K3K8_9BURK|nr:energy transducer TonB [Janthinobacterium fluminis]MDC8759464.1 energy transducer TonB [Janthinobacterium fluminis]
MNTMTMAGPGEAGLAQELLAALKAKRKQFTPLASIIILHIVLFYALQNGMLRQVVHAALPEAIMVSFVAPPEPPKPSAPAVPKTVQLSTPQPRTIVPPLPLPPLTTAPSEPTITVPQPTAAVAAPAAVPTSAPVVAAPAPPTPRLVNVNSVEFLKELQPVYPNISKRLRESGTVVLRILINDRGQPEQVTVEKSSGFANLDEAGRQAGMRTLFKPLLENGRAVPVLVTVPINFQLS